jgi:hypothetical protein
MASFVIGHALQVFSSIRLYVPAKGCRRVKKMNSYLWGLAILLVLAGPADAESALQAIPSCLTVSKGLRPDGKLYFSPDGQFCWGAFAAIQQFSRLLIADEPGKRSLDICSPETSSRLQMILVFLKYADSHPEVLDQEFPLIARQALREAFPCK